jgi:ParB family chromosome partitioning protein
MKEVRLMENYRDIPIDKIRIMQNIRTSKDEAELIGLMQSIKQNGLLEPIGVYEDDNEFILGYGSRRLEACKKLGWKTIPAIIYDKKLLMTDFLSINTIENIQRAEIKPFELGRICDMLQQQNLSVGEIAVRLSIPKSRVDNALLIYRKLPEKWKPITTYGKKPGKLSSTTINSVINLKLNKWDTELLLDETHKNDLTVAELQTIRGLSLGGCTIRDALKIYKQYKTLRLNVAVRKTSIEDLEKKYSMPIHAILRRMLNGEIPIEKHLIF